MPNKIEPWDEDYIFSKEENHPDNTIWEVEHIGHIGELLFSFDKAIVFNLWEDYPHNFTPKEKEIFDKEYPYWANYFKARNAEMPERRK